MARDYDKELRESTRYNRKQGFKRTDYESNADRWLVLGVLAALIIAFIRIF